MAVPAVIASNDQAGRVDRESNHFYTSVLPTGNLRESESPFTGNNRRSFQEGRMTHEEHRSGSWRFCRRLWLGRCLQYLEEGRLQRQHRPERYDIVEGRRGGYQAP